MNQFDKFSLILLAAAVFCLLVLFASAAHSLPLGGSAIKRVTHAISTIHSKFKKKKVIHYSGREVSIEVEPKKNYSVILNRGQRLALVLDANNGRIWDIISRPDEIADERPEGKANVTYTTIYFTPKEVNGQGDIVLKTKILENYPEDWTNADTGVVHIIVHNAP